MGRRIDLATLLTPGATAVLVPATTAAAATTTATVDARPTVLPLTALAENPDNPREELRDLEGLADTVRERGVLQPLGVVTREAFLLHYPQHRRAVGDAPYVVLHGHRRLAAARMAGLTEVPVHVRGDALHSGEDALIENVQRDDLTELEQARAIQRLVDGYAYSQRELAARLGKSQGFISQRLALLRLRPELQQALAEGALGVEDARRIARLPQEQQTLPTPAAPAQRSRRPTASPPAPQGDYAVITLDTPENIAAALRRHLTPRLLDRLIVLLADG
ncbi:ParB/RepB/Spo0J family partition protein [Streptacidiphilus sp. ASG 303]|uniref:ParB/RepB/Spo0J family partition protein n=1 Tax=Streptacidiphilus sp. ASG 303 TaxID=2896847 RepID=UPI001E5DECFB|nr:ParB/RepB/Spo0J family partition protein [Streptacidiphilus sp. ASG 303]MCD0483310.1 ParB/RepB/Spo0J family partition protein [Streptacidiphilus sp. ASG 303]